MSRRVAPEFAEGRHDEPMFVVVGSAEYDEQSDSLAPLENRPATSEIADVFPAAQRVEASQLREGDLLFDAFGGTHPLAERPRRVRGWVHTVREDGWEDTFHHADTITIIRPKETP